MPSSKKNPGATRYVRPWKPIALVLACTTAAMAHAQTDPTGNQNGALATVTVTAERVARPENKVPISMAAYSKGTLTQRGIESIDDIALKTPGITFSRSRSRSQISIRGISSTVGAQTTGIYINDTPVQVRNAGYTSTNVYPAVFDLQRVEVLRGPQGTLFGAGSEGGTIRFITTKPSFSEYSTYARAEVSQTANGSPSHEGGVAVGGPIIDGVLAFRVSGYYNHAGGYIDRVNPITGTLEGTAANWSNTDSENLSLAYKPLSRLTLTASFYHQGIFANNDDDRWWEQYSDPANGDFVSGNLLSSPNRDRLYLPSLKIEYDFGSFNVISDTSYAYRHDSAYPDYSEFLDYLLTGSPYPQTDQWYSQGEFLDTQKFFTQEVRIQSADPKARLQWIGGVFFQNNKQFDEELIPMRNLPDIFFAAHGFSYVDYYGSPLGPDYSVYTDIENITDRQSALFGQLDYEVLPGLTVTAGVRVARFNYSFASQNYGPFAGTGTNGGSHSETAVAPKYGLTYQYTDNDMVYATVARGFRPGGAERVPPSPCDSDLRALGILQPPSTYDSDNVRSYELGSKNILAGGRLNVSASVFYIKWNNIQRSVDLPVCGQNLIMNLGGATSKGFDLSVQARVAGGFLVNFAAGYTKATADETIGIAGSAHPLVVKGDSIGGVGFSPWQLTAGLEYDRVVFGGYDAFARADYEFRSQGPRFSSTNPGIDPRLIGYDPTLPPAPSNSFLSLRAGVTVGDWELSVFSDNVLNSHVELIRTRQYFTPLYYGSSFRPRTIGLRAVYRTN